MYSILILLARALIYDCVMFMQTKWQSRREWGDQHMHQDSPAYWEYFQGQRFLASAFMHSGARCDETLGYGSGSPTRFHLCVLGAECWKGL